MYGAIHRAVGVMVRFCCWGRTLVSSNANAPALAGAFGLGSALRGWLYAVLLMT